MAATLVNLMTRKQANGMFSCYSGNFYKEKINRIFVYLAVANQSYKCYSFAIKNTG